MKNNSLNNIQRIVEDILIEDVTARKDDCYLILRVVEILHPDEIEKTFEEVMLNAKKNRINFESVRRCRQKVQAEHPELKDEVTSFHRNRKMFEFSNFAKER